MKLDHLYYLEIPLIRQHIGTASPAGSGALPVREQVRFLSIPRWDELAMSFVRAVRCIIGHRFLLRNSV